MKKSIFFVAAVALFASCAEQSTVYTEDGVANEIALTQVVNLSKTVVTGTAFPEELDFNVFAWYSNKKNAEAALSNEFTVPYLNDMPFTKSTEDKIWWGGTKVGGHTPYYWPKTGSLVFAGYHGNAEVKYDPTAGTRPDSLNILHYTASYNTKGDDLMYFPVTDGSYNQNGQMGAFVPVKFYHALSWITIQDSCANNVNPSIDSLFQINSITIDNVYPKGSAQVLRTQSTHVCAEDCIWAVEGTASDVTVATADSVVTEKIKLYGDEYFVIPQPGTTITINYSMKAFGKSKEYVKQDTYTYTVTETWQPGKHYIYTFVFKANEILIQPTIEEWAEVPVGPIYVPKA